MEKLKAKFDQVCAYPKENLKPEEKTAEQTIDLNQMDKDI